MARHQSESLPRGGSGHAGSRPERGRGRRWALLALVALTIVAYWNALDAPFAFDDHEGIELNPLIRDLGHFFPPGAGADVPASHLQRYVHGARFLAMLSLAVDYRFWRLDPRGYHATSLAIHVVATLLLFGVVGRTLRLPAFATSRLARRPHEAALLVAALFAVHPIQTQAVTYIYQRMAALVTLFCLVALDAYARSRIARTQRARIGWMALCGLALLAAMKTKENAFTFPLVLVLYELVCFRAPAKVRLRRLAVPLCMLLVVPVSSFRSISARAQAPSERLAKATRGTVGVGRTEYLATETRVVASYLGLLLVPVGQNIDHDVPWSRSLLEPKVLVASAFLAALATLAIWLASGRDRRDPGWALAGFGLASFFVLLAVESGLFPLPDAMFEHRVYLPSWGFFLAVVGALLLLAGERFRRAALAALALAILALAATTRARNEVWRDELTLWEDALSKSPRKPRVIFNVGLLRGARDGPRVAEAWFRRVLEVDPDYTSALVNLGSFAAQRGDLASAETYFRRAVSSNEDEATALANLGELYCQRGDREEALRWYEKAVRAAPWKPGPARRAEQVRASPEVCSEAPPDPAAGD